MEYKNNYLSSNNKIIENPLHSDNEYSLSFLAPSYEAIDNLLINDFISSNNLMK
ncbi:MAG: hypothetical protein ACRC7R_12150 [Sarcina sp.]